jgi:HEAT repeat protein
VLRALGETRDERALDVLSPLVRSPTPLLAVVAVESLAKLGSPIEVLLQSLEHSDAEVVKAGLFAVSERNDPRVLGGLVSCLAHETVDVRGLAAELLARHPGEASKAELRGRLAQETNPTVREAITRSLERMSGVRRTPPIFGGSLPPR